MAARPTLGAQIRKHREQAGLSLRALADLAGVPHATICRIEGDHEQPSWNRLARIAEALGTTLDGVTDGVPRT